MKRTIIKNNFSAGELAPTLYTRTDIQQYSNGAKTLTNVIPLVEGGVRKRPGTFFLAEKAGAVRLIPFVVSSENSFMLILKAASIEVFNPRTKTVVATLVTPYTAAQIPDIQFVQYRYEMFMTHKDVPVQRFRSSEDFTNWEMAQFDFAHPPLDSDNARSPYRKGASSSKELGRKVTFNARAVPTWSSTTAYLANDEVKVVYTVAVDGWFPKTVTEYYKALLDSTSKNPRTEPTYWELLADSGNDVFSAADVGSYIEINGGIIKITRFIDENNVGGEVVKKLDSTIEAIERSWLITPPAFNATNGYPRCCTYYKQRLVLANINKAPNKIWFSAVGGNGNFLETTDDADAFSIVSASGLSNSILFLEAQRGVVCLTSGGEYLVDSTGTLTPTTVSITEHTAFGAYPVTRPERIGGELLFVQRGGERLRAISYRYEVDGLVSPEVSSLASHIGEIHGGISAISYQQEPESIVWCVLGDGKVTSITFNRDQEVLAWAQHDFGGTVLSMCSMPTQLGSDRSFLLIQRSNTVCLEELSFDAYVDSQRSVTLANLTVAKPSYLSNLSAYQINAESIYEVSFTDAGSNVEFPADLINSTVNYGQTFECVAEMFPPELNQNPLSSTFDKAKIDRIALFFNKTLAPMVNDELVELFTFDDNPMEAQKPYSGIHMLETGTWSDWYKAPLIISHNKPLPFHLQAITMQMSINER